MRPFTALMVFSQLAAGQMQGTDSSYGLSNTFYVAKSSVGGKPYFTDLNAAVDSVSSSGTTIVVSPGTYDVKQITLTHKHNFLRIVGSGRGTIIRPQWDGEQPYKVSHFGYQTFHADSVDALEISNFTYDGRGDSITNTQTTLLRFGTFTACRDLYLHDIYAVNGGNIQDKGFAGLYNCQGGKCLNNTVIDFDVAFMVTNHLSGRMIISQNTIIGGKSEGIIIWTDTRDTFEDAYRWSTNPRSIVVSDNYVYDKDTYAIAVKRSWNAAVSIVGNAIGRTNEYPGHAGGGIALDSCSDVTIVGNTYSGTSCFIAVSGYAKNVSIVGNPVQYLSGGSFLYHALGNATRELENFSITSNPIAGDMEAPAWSPARTYEVGEMVSMGTQKSYLCRVKNSDKKPPNTYWDTVSHDYAAIWGWFKNSIISGNTISGVRNAGIRLDRRPTNLKVVDNTITNTRMGILLRLNPDDTTGSSSVDNLQIRGNTINTLDSTGNGYALLIDSYKLTNAIISENYLTSTYHLAGATQFRSRILENVAVENNSFGGNPGGVVYQERGGARKRNNVTLDGGKIGGPDTSVGGRVSAGETFWATNPGGAIGYFCSAAGYGTRGYYSTGVAYEVGDHVTGPDGNIYRCVRGHNATADDKPKSGNHWMQYWSQAGPRAQFKEVR